MNISSHFFFSLSLLSFIFNGWDLFCPFTLSNNWFSEIFLYFLTLRTMLKYCSTDKSTCQKLNITLYLMKTVIIKAQWSSSMNTCIQYQIWLRIRETRWNIAHFRHVWLKNIVWRNGDESIPLKCILQTNLKKYMFIIDISLIWL